MACLRAAISRMCVSFFLPFRVRKIVQEGPKIAKNRDTFGDQTKKRKKCVFLCVSESRLSFGLSEYHTVDECSNIIKEVESIKEEKRENCHCMLPD